MKWWCALHSMRRKFLYDCKCHNNTCYSIVCCARFFLLLLLRNFYFFIQYLQFIFRFFFFSSYLQKVTIFSIVFTLCIFLFYCRMLEVFFWFQFVLPSLLSLLLSRDNKPIVFQCKPFNGFEWESIHKQTLIQITILYDSQQTHREKIA